MSRRGEVLVAIMNNLLDMREARENHWYRIPIESQEKWLKDCWPPETIAFYQTKKFGDEAFAVNYYAQVLHIRAVFRWQLFPNEPRDAKAQQRYYQLNLSPLQPLPKPILSRRWRRIVFIPTTWDKLQHAIEVNDLYDESPLEDCLWAEFKRLQISAERQEFIRIGKEDYALDFAIYCALGKIDVETDGDSWHSDPKRIPQDNLRDNALETAGWSLLRFSTRHIREKLEAYCLPTVVKEINNLGGIDEGKAIARKIDLAMPRGMQQPSLFDSKPDENN